VPSLTIGELSERTGEAPHVLRHWEDVGVLRSRRTPSGHRRYHPSAVAGVLTIRRLQRVGLGLSDIAALHRSGKGDRRALLADHQVRLAEQRASIDAALAFLAHTADCVHPILDECPGCAAFAADPGVRRAQ
jgi:MerR family copper efflux transcriptional regulator